MNLLHPLALAWLGLAVPIVIFYILKIRMRRVPVSTILFWRQIFEEKQPKSLWQKLRHLLSLLIQVAFLLLLVFALTEPIFRWEIRDARRLVLVVDNSASMNASDVAPAATRLAKAKEEALKLIDGLRSRDEMAIVAAGTQPTVRCGLTGHQGTLREKLDADPPDRRPDPGEGGRRAGPAAPRRPGRRQAAKGRISVVVLTDGGFDGRGQARRGGATSSSCRSARTRPRTSGSPGSRSAGA